VTGSLAYRKNEDAIRAGEIPTKYTRLLPFIKGDRILEIGSAEGVLALLLAKQGKRVTAIERSAERHETAQTLFAEWLGREKRFIAPTFINGDIADNLWTLKDKDALVCVRSIYYLGGRLNTIFSDVAKFIPTVVLCGNANRARRWREGAPDEPLGDFNRYAAREGMTELLTRHGYRITQVVSEGDEIVVGER
jgi:SAM-dependent methyltransferase